MPGTGLALNGSHWAQTPDNAALDISGDIDIRAAIVLADWTPGVEATLANKADVQFSYLFDVLTDGRLRFAWSTDGSVANIADSSVAPTVADGALLLIKATGQVPTTVKFWTKTSTPANAFADSDSNIGWTQLGTTQTTVSNPTIFNSSSTLRTGVNVVGVLYALIVKNGIDGTAVANPDFYANDLPFTDAAGRPWTFEPPSITVGLADETDSAFAITASTTGDTSIGVGIATESDYALALRSATPILPTAYTGREPVIALGCGSYSVMLTERGGHNPIAYLPFNQLSWNRTVDDVGSATITVPLAGQLATDECCAALTRVDSFDGVVDSWSHEITILRDGQLVFVGPIVGMTFSFADVQIECRDLFAWFDKRWLPVSRDVISDLAQIFETFAQDALNQDPSPNITFIGYATNTVNRRTIRAEDFIKAGSFLRELGKDGVDFAMVGRTLYFGNLDNLAVDLKADLALPQYAVVDGKLEKRGLEAATQFTLTGQPPGGAAATIHATVGGKNIKYGLLQESQSESFITVPAFLRYAAQSRLAMIRTPPRYLDVTLDPKAPFTVNELVASFLIHVNLQVGCAQVHETMRIHQVQGQASVADNGEESESVTLTITPQGDPHLTLGFPLGFEFS